MTTVETLALVAMLVVFDVGHGACCGLARRRSLMMGPLGMLAYAWVRSRGWRW